LKTCQFFAVTEYSIDLEQIMETKLKMKRSKKRKFFKSYCLPCFWRVRPL